MVEHCIYCGEEVEHGGYRAKGETYCDQDCYYADWPEEKPLAEDE
jgi:hypothetical protein